MTMNKGLYIIKSNGKRVLFEKEKLKNSLLKSGATNEQVNEIAQIIEEMIVDGLSTRKIYKLAFRLLKQKSKHLAARYKLKNAIFELGPSGFPFEIFIAEILNYKNYNTKVGVIVKGHCVSHEIDIIAEKDNQHYMIECKFHNKPNYYSDVKIPLYIQSRFLDVEYRWKQMEGHEQKIHQGWVITNTRFSEDAIQYAQCMNLHLVGWNYPPNNAIKDWIDATGTHPITSLTTLTGKEKKILLDMNIVLCKSLHQNETILIEIGISSNRINNIIQECHTLCIDYNKLY